MHLPQNFVANVVEMQLNNDIHNTDGSRNDVGQVLDVIIFIVCGSYYF